MNLYQINAAIENFEFQFDEKTGEVSNYQDLEDLELERNAKLENIALYIKNLKSDSEAIDNEAQALLERSKAKKKKAMYFSDYLKQALNGSKFETPKVNISYRKSKSVEIEDVEAFLEYARDNCLDNLYKRKVTLEPVKKEIKDFITKSGEELPFVALKENVNLQIK